MSALMLTRTHQLEPSRDARATYYGDRKQLPRTWGRRPPACTMKTTRSIRPRNSSYYRLDVIDGA